MVIGVPTVDRGTGRNLALSCLTKAGEWTDIQEIIGGVFDTTASNTGVHEGGMTHIEAHIQNRQLWFACNHHKDELIIKHVYDVVMHPATGPDDPLFKAFKTWWTGQKGSWYIIHVLYVTLNSVSTAV